MTPHFARCHKSSSCKGACTDVIRIIQTQNDFLLFPSVTIAPLHYLLNFTVFWATVCKTVRPMLSDRCMSETLVYCGQTVGRTKMKLGMQIGLGTGHIVFDGDTQLPSPKRERGPNFRPMSIVPKQLGGSRCHLVWR